MITTTRAVTEAATLSENIRTALKNRGRTQEWLSRKAGIPHTTLSRKLSTGNFNVFELSMVAQALTTSVADLLAPPASSESLAA